MVFVLMALITDPHSTVVKLIRRHHVLLFSALNIKPNIYFSTMLLSRFIIRNSPRTGRILPPHRYFSQCPIYTNTTIPPFTRRLFKLPPPPPTPSQHHHNLTTFLSYANRISLPETSTTYIGTHYEYTVQQTLHRFALSLHRVGGRDDAGVDLVGTWHLPQREHPLRVFVQCKSLKTKLGPNLVRELEGSFRQSPGDKTTTSSNDNTVGGGKVGILVSTREATKGVRDAMARSVYPLMWMMVERNGALQQALWNAKVEELGLGALEVEVQYGVGGPDSTTKGNIALTWDGEEIPDMDQVQKDMAALESRWLALWEKKNGSCLSMPESSKLELLDLVEKLYPEEKPLFTTTGVTGTCSTLSEEDREKVLRHLSTRLQPAQTEGV